MANIHHHGGHLHNRIKHHNNSHSADALVADKIRYNTHGDCDNLRRQQKLFSAADFVDYFCCGKHTKRSGDSREKPEKELRVAAVDVNRADVIRNAAFKKVYPVKHGRYLLQKSCKRNYKKHLVVHKPVKNIL